MAMALDPEAVQVTSFQTTQPSPDASTDISWPDVCTCIDICQPTEDIYCSGGCPPDTTIVVVDQPAY